MVEKEYLSWIDVEHYVKLVGKRYRHFNLSGVYGIPRGGLCLAVMISHRLDIPLLMSPIENCLIVDDICDSGESLLHYYNNSSSIDNPKYYITTMMYNEDCRLVKPDYYWGDKTDKWIVFPWEVD